MTAQLDLQLALGHAPNSSRHSPCRRSDGSRLRMQRRQLNPDQITIALDLALGKFALFHSDDRSGMPVNAWNDHAGRSGHESDQGCRRRR